MNRKLIKIILIKTILKITQLLFALSYTKFFYIDSSPMTSVKYVSNRPNLHVRLERVEAPAHVLDHQYAVEKRLKSGVLNSLVPNQNENNLQFNRNIIINEPKSTEKNR